MVNKYALSAAACITFLRKVGDLLPYESLRALNAADKILRREKSGVYAAMRGESAGAYLDLISRRSRRRDVPESEIAENAVRAADEKFSAGGAAPETHCGCYLFKRNAKRAKFYQLLYIAPNYAAAAAMSLLLSALVPDGWPRLVYATVAYPIFVYIAKLIATGFLKFFARPDVLPRMDFSRGVPDRHRTLAVVSQLIATPDEMERAVRKLGANAFAEADKNIGYCLLADLPASKTDGLTAADEAVIAAGRAAWEKLKSEYPCHISLYIRKRAYNAKEKQYMGWERKRGALMQLCKHFLSPQCTVHSPQLKDGVIHIERNDDEKTKSATVDCGLCTVDCGKGNSLFHAAFGDGEFSPVNIVALDADTAAPPGAVLHLTETAAHPLNFRYNVFSPRIRTNPLTTADTPFTRLFADSPGFDSYSSGAFDVYQDIFHIGIFHGKGLFRIREFHDMLYDTLPENRILSHDLIEGAIAGAANTRAAFYDTYPSGYRSYVKRNLRWIRGDWQLMPYLLPTFLTRLGKRRKNPLQPLSLWQIGDNLFYSLLAPCGLALLALSPFCGAAFVWPLLTGLSFHLSAFLTDVYVNGKALFHRASLTAAFRHIGAGFLRLLFNIAVLPHYALCSLCAIALTLTRMTFKRNLMKWETFAHTLPGKKKTPPKPEIPEGERAYYLSVARQTWAYFRDTLTAENKYLPCDNFQEEGGVGWARRTSPTNIGFGLLAAVCARDMGFIGGAEFADLVSRVLETVQSLKKYKGNLYNWYDAQTLEVLKPAYVSSVDSGNFLACLLALRSALREAQRGTQRNAQCNGHFSLSKPITESPSKEHGHFSLSEPVKDCPSKENSPAKKEKSVGGLLSGNSTQLPNDKNPDRTSQFSILNSQLVKTIDALIAATDLSCLYDPKKGLFRVGYDEASRDAGDAHYDLLASEAQLLAFTAVALKKAGAETWARLSRARVRAAGAALRSWTGGMFEYLMPRLLLQIPRGSLLSVSNRNAVRGQIAFCKRHGLPFFGVSESQYNVRGRRGDYQYKAFGIDALAIKNIGVQRVVSPYAAFLALGVSRKAAGNLRRMDTAAQRGKYGFYEALDCGSGDKNAVVRSFMAHHQGMILCAVHNALNGGALIKRFMSDLRTAGAALLLTEPAPATRAARKKTPARAERKGKRGAKTAGGGAGATDAAAKIGAIKPNTAQAGLLANGRLRSILNARGDGHLTFDGFALTRFRLFRGAGLRFAVERPDGTKIDLSALTPKAVFKSDKILYVYQTRGLQITVEAAVSPAYAVEARRVRVRDLKNKGGVCTVTSYFEPALCPRDEDVAHPAFSELFLRTEIRRQDNAVVVERTGNRRAPALIHAAAAEKAAFLRFETSRFNFWGRGARSPSEGFTVAPCVSIACGLPLQNGTAEAAYLTGAAYEGGGAAGGVSRMIALMNSPGFADDVFTAAGTAARIGETLAANHLSTLLSKLLEDRIPAGVLKGLAGRELNVLGLKRLGADLRYPTVRFRLEGLPDCGRLKAAAAAVEILKKCINFTFCVVYAEKAGYRTPLGTAAREAAAGADAIFVNTTEEFPETVAALEAIAIEAN
ncbi:MAG: hypothetical protein LBL66_00985 [Clostridiales bacterium]|nr:hypothetical protein [Clostridiales bacterium]